MTFGMKYVGIASAVAICASVTLAFAGGHTPVEQREAIMKTMGQSAKTIGDMLKGETAFDAVVANETLVTMQTAVANLGDLFPEGTELAGENENAAGPAIWTDRAGFEAKIAAFQEDISAAVSAAPQEKEAMAVAFGEVAQNCKSCHEAYRVKK